MHGGGGSGSRPHSPKAQHLSLLSAILSSPDNGSKPSLHRAEFKRAPSGPNGMISGSSNPSTTMSSPAAREPHGILQNAQAQAAAVAKADAPPSSILRRESLGPVEEANVQAAAGSGVGLGLGFGAGGPAGGQEGYNGLDGLAGRLEKVEERRERIGWADKVEKQSVSCLTENQENLLLIHPACLDKSRSCPLYGIIHRSSPQITIRCRPSSFTWLHLGIGGRRYRRSAPLHHHQH